MMGTFRMYMTDTHRWMNDVHPKIPSYNQRHFVGDAIMPDEMGEYPGSSLQTLNIQHSYKNGIRSLFGYNESGSHVYEGRLENVPGTCAL